MKEYAGNTNLEKLFGWEIAHRSDSHRRRRKIEQLIVDEITFVCSGIIALCVFWLLVPQSPIGITFLSWLELLLLIALGIEIVIYADLAKGR